jgi:DNA-binding XRE family transcriptional regulator
LHPARQEVAKSCTKVLDMKSGLAIADKVLLLSESAMIRAPKQLECGQAALGARNTECSRFNMRNYTRQLTDAQPKSSWYGDMKGIQCKLARVALGWGVLELAKNANVSTQTITRLERDEQLRPATLESIKTALENAGIEFIDANGGGVGVRFKNPS